MDGSGKGKERINLSFDMRFADHQAAYDYLQKQAAASGDSKGKIIIRLIAAIARSGAGIGIVSSASSETSAAIVKEVMIDAASKVEAIPAPDSDAAHSFAAKADTVPAPPKPVTQIAAEAPAADETPTDEMEIEGLATDELISLLKSNYAL